MSNQAIVFELNSKAGFYSIFFFICQCYIYAKKNNIPFFIKNRDWLFTNNEGWHDYFDSLNDYDASKHNYNIILCSHNNTNIIKNNNYTTEDYIECIKEIYLLKKDLIKKANELKNEFGIYKAIFVRRGDKIVEASRINEKDILKNIKYDDQTKFFIQTDDYTVIEEFKKLLPNNQILSTVDYNKRGSFRDKKFLKFDKSNKFINSVIPLNKKNSSQIKKETEEMLIGLQLCILADECWTDYTSNVGRFLLLSKKQNIYTYPNNINLTENKIILPFESL